jgi:diamine N-acetyltransferase
MQFNLRRCVPGDENALSLIARATILETYPGLSNGEDIYSYVATELGPDEFREYLSRKDAPIWALETQPGKAMVGYALVHPTKSATELELHRLYLFYRFHGLGLGKRLMEAILLHARERGFDLLTLQVHERNEGAIAFYERYGFKTVGAESFHAGERDYRVLVMQRKIAE